MSGRDARSVSLVPRPSWRRSSNRSKPAAELGGAPADLGAWCVSYLEGLFVACRNVPGDQAVDGTAWDAEAFTDAYGEEGERPRLDRSVDSRARLTEQECRLFVALREGDVGPAAHAYAEHGRVTITGTIDQARQHIEEATFATKAFSVGDRVIFEKNRWVLAADLADHGRRSDAGSLALTPETPGTDQSQARSTEEGKAAHALALDILTAAGGHRSRPLELRYGSWLLRGGNRRPMMPRSMV